jgi:hypothetical protein
MSRLFLKFYRSPVNNFEKNCVATARFNHGFGNDARNMAKKTGGLMLSLTQFMVIISEPFTGCAILS